MLCFKCRWTLLPLLFYSFAWAIPHPVKIGIVSGPGSDRRQNSERFWSFARDFSSPVVLEPLVQEIPLWTSYHVARAVCSVVKSGARTLVAIQAPPRLGALLSSYSNQLRLPLVTATSGASGRLQLDLLPGSGAAVASLVQHYGWESFAFIYDGDTGADYLQKITQLLDTPPVIEAFWRVYDANDAYPLLMQLPSSATRVLLATTEELADELFLKLGNSTMNFHGILLKPVGTLRKTVTSRSSSLVKFSMVDEGSGLVRDLENRWKTLEEGWTHRVDGKEFPDMALLSHDTSKVLYNVFENIAARSPEVLQAGDLSSMDCFNYTQGLPASVAFTRNTIFGKGVSGALQFDEEGQRRGYSLSIALVTPSLIRQIGQWSSGQGLQLREDTLPGPSVAAFRTSPPVIRVTSILSMPFLKMGENGNFEGYVVDFVNELSNITGRKLEIQLVKDGRFGANVVEGEWNGMIGELIRNESDVVIADLTKNTERAKVVYFGQTFMTFGLNVMVKRPTGQQEDSRFGPFSFLSVWSGEVWAVVLLLVLFFGALCYGASRFVGVPDRVRALESKGTDNLSPCGALWFTIGSLLQRDTGIYPHSLTHRVWALLWWAFCFFLIVCYISSLTEALIRTRSTLTTTYSRKTSQEVLQDCVRKGSPDIGVIGFGSTMRFFRNSEIGLYKDFGNYLQQKPGLGLRSYAEAAERVRKSDGNFAFITESVSSEFHVNQPPCDLVVTPGYFTTRTFALTLQKNSSLKELLDHGVLTMMERGYLRQLYEKWWHNYTDYCEDPNMDLLPKVYSNSMTLHEVSGLFYILILCALLSLLAAFIEHYILSKRMSLE